MTTQPQERSPVDWQNPAWTADTEALAHCLWRLIHIYRTGQVPAIRSPDPSSSFCIRRSRLVAQEPATE